VLGWWGEGRGELGKMKHRQLCSGFIDRDLAAARSFHDAAPKSLKEE